MAVTDKNPEGLTWREWIDAAGLSWDVLKKIPTYEEARKDWQAGVDPTEWRGRHG